MGARSEEHGRETRPASEFGCRPLETVKLSFHFFGHLPPNYWGLTLAGTAHFAIFDGTEGMICLPRVLPLIELELRDKNERVGHDEGKLIIPDFRVCSHLMTL